MPAIGCSWRLVNVSPSSREAVTASSKNISKKSPRRKSSKVSRGKPRFTSKYCCIIGVSFASDIAAECSEEGVARSEEKSAAPVADLSPRHSLRAVDTFFRVKLFHRDLGGTDKPPLILLHGMLGSSRNWQTAGAELSEHFHVCALDLRNHGKSPHADHMSYDEMLDDVLAWLDEHEVSCATVVGHSMGGKIAMLLACRHPARVE